MPGATPTRVAAWMPPWLREYDLAWLRLDVVAGITVLAYMVPQVLAYTGIVGAPPISGVVTAVAALVVYAILGTSRSISVGPEASVALMAGFVLAPLVARRPEDAPALLAALTLLVGMWLLVGGALRMGVIAQLLTPPILTGFLTGEAVLMMASQLGHATRTPGSGTNVPGQVKVFLRHIEEIHPGTVGVTMATIALLLLLPRIHPRIPAPLVVVALATVASLLLTGAAHGLEELGNIPRGVPTVTVPAFDGETFAALLVGSLGIALLAFSDLMLVARGFSEPDEDVNANRELLAVGAVHVVAAFGGGYPASASGSRTAIAVGARQRSQVSGLVSAAGMILVVGAAAPALEFLPRATLAGVVIWAGFRLVDLEGYRRLWRFRRSEFSIALLTAAGTALLGILPGLGVALTLSALQILVALSHPHEAVQAFAVGLAGLHDIDDHPDHALVPGLLLYRYDGPLIAYNRYDFRKNLTAAVEEFDPRWVVLNVEANMLVDFSACETLRDVISLLQAEGRVVGLARLKLDLRLQLEAAGIMALVDGHVFETLPQAIKAYHEANPDAILPPLPAPGEPFDPHGPSSIH